MKEVFLCLLYEGGKNGLEEVIDNLQFIVRSTNTMLRCKINLELVLYFFKCIFDESVQKLLIQRVVELIDPEDDQSLLLKVFDFFANLNESEIYCLFARYQDSKKLRETTLLTEPETQQLIRLSFSSNNEEVIDGFLKYFIRNMHLKSTSNFVKELVTSFHTNGDVRSAADARVYLSMLRKDFLRNYIIDLVWEVPNLLLTIIKSATYLINCWKLLNVADLVVEMKWIEERLGKLLPFILFIAKNAADHNERSKQLSKAGMDRFVRCATSAFDKTRPSRSKHFLGVFLTCQRLKIDVCFIYRFFTFTCSYDIVEFVSEMEKLELQTHLKWDTLIASLEINNDIERLKAYENQLPPLSREDSQIYFVPCFVEDALRSLPDSELLSVPKEECWSLTKLREYRIS